MERSRPSTTVRRDDPGEFRVGRLKHERVKVPRGEAMMEWAESVMQLHADRKSVLEVSRRGFSFTSTLVVRLRRFLFSGGVSGGGGNGSRSHAGILCSDSCRISKDFARDLAV